MGRALIVVDMQNDFVTGSLGTKEAEAIVPAVEDKIKNRLEEGWDIIFTRDTHEESYLSTKEGKKLPVRHCIRGTEGFEIIKELKPYAKQIIDKPTFGSVRLVETVADKEYEEVELIGLCTDICVVSNALLLKAHFPELQLEVDPSCCAGVTPKSHEAAIETMKMCQIDMVE